MSDLDVEAAIRTFRDEIRNLVPIGDRIEKTPFVTRRSFADGAFWQIAHDLAKASLTELIESEGNWGRGLGVPVEWKAFSFDLESSYLGKLEAGGFEVGDREEVVVIPVLDQSDPEDIVVTRVSSERELRDFKSVAEGVFSKDYSFTVGELAKAIKSGDSSHVGYIAYLNDEPVSVGRIYLDSKSQFAGLYCGGTLSEYRGRGFYRAVISARLREAHRAGVPFALVDALPTSFPILQRLGFSRLASTWPCELAH